MRRTMFNTMMLALAAVLAMADVAAAQGELGIGYQLTTNVGAGRGRVDGVTFQYDSPRFGPITMATNGSFSTEHGTGGQKSMCFGAGPGFRFYFEEMTFYGHFLLGAEIGTGTMLGVQTTESEFKTRTGIGMSYRLSDRYRLRGGVDFDTHAHIVVGVGMRF